MVSLYVTNCFLQLVITLCLIAHHLSEASTVDKTSAEKWQSNWEPETSINTLLISKDDWTKFIYAAPLIMEDILPTKRIYGNMAEFQQLYKSVKSMQSLTSKSLIAFVASNSMETEKDSFSGISSIDIANILIKELTEKITHFPIGQHLYTISMCNNVNVDHGKLKEYTKNEYPPIEPCSIGDVAIAMKVKIINNTDDDNSSKNEGYMVIAPKQFDHKRIYIFMNNKEIWPNNDSFVRFLPWGKAGWEEVVHRVTQEGGYLVVKTSDIGMVFYVKRVYRNYALTQKMNLLDPNKYIHRQGKPYEEMGANIAQLDVKIEKDPKVLMKYGTNVYRQWLIRNSLNKLPFHVSQSFDKGSLEVTLIDKKAKIENNVCPTCGDEVNPKSQKNCEDSDCLFLSAGKEFRDILWPTDEEKQPEAREGRMYRILYDLQQFVTNSVLMDAFTGIDPNTALVEIMEIMSTPETSAPENIKGIDDING